VAGVNLPPEACSISATTPAITGDDIDVPDAQTYDTWR
jgi:hypothetical protein